MTVNLMLQLSSRAAIRYINHQILLNTQFIFLINMTQGNLLPITLHSVEKRLKSMSISYLLCFHFNFGAQFTFVN